MDAAAERASGNSYYTATAHAAPAVAELSGSEQADVCIVGGGYTGVNAAIELAQKGYSVVLVEAHRIGWGCSGRNGGQVISGLASWSRLLRQLGPGDARIAWNMGNEGVEIILDRIRRHDIRCDFKPGYFNAACNGRQMRDLEAEHAQKQSMGYPHATELVGVDGLASVIASRRYAGGLFDPGGAHLHPLNLCLGEAAVARKLGVRIYECSPVLRIGTGPRPRVETARGGIDCIYAFVAGNAYLGNLVPELKALILPAGSYIIATEPLGEDTARGLLPRDCAVSDENTLLDYFRLSADHRLLFGGRCNHTGRVPGNIGKALLPRMLRVFPQLRGVRIDYEWGGNVAVSLKRIPQLGRLHGNVFYAQGYSGHGLAATHIAGRLLAEVISGQAERFDLLARIRHWRIPMRDWLGGPALAIGMTWYRLRDAI